MYELGKLFLPTLIDFKPESDTITFYGSEYGTTDYIYDIECYLYIKFYGDEVAIDYYCEDDEFLTDKLCYFYIAKGNLKIVSLQTIQEEALRVMSEHIHNKNQQELIDHFDSKANHQEMFDLGDSYLPSVLYYNKKDNSIIMLKFQKEYEEHKPYLRFDLQISFSGNTAYIDYYCLNDDILSMCLKEHIAKGELDKESFHDIQERAVSVLNKYMNKENRKKLLDHFNNL